MIQRRAFSFFLLTNIFAILIYNSILIYKILLAFFDFW